MDFGWAVELTVSIPEPQFYRVFFGENNQYPKLKVAPKKKRLFHGKFEFTGNVHAEMWSIIMFSKKEEGGPLLVINGGVWAKNKCVTGVFSPLHMELFISFYL